MKNELTQLEREVNELKATLYGCFWGIVGAIFGLFIIVVTVALTQ